MASVTETPVARSILSYFRLFCSYGPYIFIPYILPAREKKTNKEKSITLLVSATPSRKGTKFNLEYECGMAIT